MLAILLALASVTAEPCQLELSSAAPGENHVLFRGASPDGRSLAIGWDKGEGSATKRGAFLLDLQSHKRTDLPHLNNAPSFSPDGKYLVSANYAGGELKTEIVELDRRTARAKVYASGPSLEWLASYASDGKTIVFNSTRTGASDLYRASRNRGAIDRITADPRYEAHGQLFDRDHKLIFHRQTEGDNYDIVIRDLKTGKERLVGATPLEEGYPAMSPDMHWIAFSAVTKAGQQPHLFIMRSDGSGRRQLTNNPSKDAYAAWAPDGRTLYFVRFDKDGSKIYRIDMRADQCRN